MQYITTGNRIAVENFTIGDLYTITFTNGNYINTACIGIGANFVTFQRNEPELLFSLTMETAELVSTIDLYAAGSGTNNYNELQNKPTINSVELVGNKSLSDLGIQSEITAENPLSSALISGLGSAAAADTSDFATAAQGTLADSAVQPDDMTAALALKQDALSSAQLDAVNSGITSTDVAQIETNKNNISLLTANGGGKNLLDCSLATLKADSYNTGGSYSFSWTDNVCSSSRGVSFTINADNTITVTATSVSADVWFRIAQSFVYEVGSYTLSGCPANGSTSTYYIESDNLNIRDTGNGATITRSSSYTDSLFIVVKSGTTFTGTFKPMISLSSDKTYQPYAPSNAELYAMIQALQAQLANQ